MVSFLSVHLYTPQFTVLFKTMSAAVYGIDASIIEVEVDVLWYQDQRRSFPYRRASGCSRGARAASAFARALRNCGYDVPPTHITINLAPADIKKEGSGFGPAHGAWDPGSLRCAEIKKTFPSM